MEVYTPELERVAAFFKAVPGRVNETNIKRLGIQNHLEMFEDQSNNGKRLSFSGSIVVIDIDFEQDKVAAVNVALASNIAKDAKHSFMAAVNEPQRHILASLGEPRLNKFAQMLEFIARCDRYSTKEVDCFKALDSISAAIFHYVTQHPDSEFGTVQVNPADRLGVGMTYYQNQYAFLNVVPGSRREFSIRMREHWLSDDGHWLPLNTDTSGAADTRAELALTLDPPVIVTEDVVQELSAVCTETAQTPILNNRRPSAFYSLRRHPRHGNVVDEYEITVGNLLPYRLVEVTQIPLRGPSEIPQVLAKLKQASLLNDLITSVLNRPGCTIPLEPAPDVSVADALELVNQKVQPTQSQAQSKKIIAHATLQPHNSELGSAQINVGFSSYSELLSIIVPRGSGLRVEYDGPDRSYIQKLVGAGQLALALSYIVGSKFADTLSAGTMETD